MPAKYSHAKKRPPGRAKKLAKRSSDISTKDQRIPNVHVDRGISQAMTAVSQLERAIARLLLIRFEQDIARLFSTHLYYVALLHLPTFVMQCVNAGGPGWVAANADCDEIKDFFRSAIGMDLRQAGERVATKSVLWSYTALRHFAMSNNVPICQKRGLHSLRLLPYFPALKSHLDTLQAMPTAAFSKPPHLAPLTEGVGALEDACERKFAKTSVHGDWDPEWRHKVRVGYERVSQTLWRVAREFDVRGYGLVLREKLVGKWCDCGCSTDHLSEVCEKTVREDEEESGVRPGKEREWDGRGSGVFGWGTEEEEDIWDVDLDFVSLEADDCTHGEHRADVLTIGEVMEWRFFRAEHEKEQGNVSFKRGEYATAIEQYKTAHQVEPEMPHYQLNLAAAYLKLQRWMEAEKACDAALSQHKSVKGHWRRAQARKAQDKNADAIKDIRAVLRLQPTNAEAQAELNVLSPPPPPPDPAPPELTPPSRIRHPPRPSSSTALAGSSSGVAGPSFPSSSSSTFASGSSSSSASGSSSSAFSPSGSSSSSTSHYPSPYSSSSPSRSRPSAPTPTRSRPSKQKVSPPFPRSPSDSRKLKITALPMTVDVPVSFEPLGGRKVRFGFKAGKGKGGVPREREGAYKAQTFVYPSWERYAVKKVAD